MKEKKVRKKLKVDKYNFGSFVTQNQQGIAGAGNALAGVVSGVAGDSVGGSAVSGALSGAATGSLLGPPGMIVGGLLGGLGGLLGGNKRKREQERIKQERIAADKATYANNFTANIDTANENPYGVYANGGDVKKAYNPKGASKNKDFQNWYSLNTLEGQNNIPYNNDMGYDYYSFFMNGDYKDSSFNIENHFPDTYKRPSHPTFSNESIYSTPENPGGSWNGENYNPKGMFIYANGGAVAMPVINIEEGELQIDPVTGKILREYSGINPETGGKYKPHSKGKDTNNNMVTAQEGSFIITKEKAKEYKDAIDTNDKLHQNAILQNIKNKKRSQDRKDVQAKYDTGGRVNVDGLQGISLPFTAGTPTFNTPSRLALPNIVPTFNPNTGATVNSGINSSGILNTVVDLAPAAMNIAQSFRTPDYLPRASTEVNPYRSEVLNNLPTEVNMTPLINRSYRDRNAAFNRIANTTSSSAVARANMGNVGANTERAIQDAYFQGELTNNQIRGQRASLYNQLGEADRASATNTRNYNLGIETSNRQMDLANRQYRNLGLSQLQELYRNRQNMNRLGNRDQMELEAIRRAFPALQSYLPGILGQGGTYGR